MLSVPVHSGQSPSRSSDPPSIPDVAHTDSRRNYEVRLALTEGELAEAQRLRHEVFAGEWGAALTQTHLDVDSLDPWCDHLIVRELRTASIVGTYRLLPPDRATVAGGYNWLSGCTSVSLADSGIQAASVWYEVSTASLAPTQHRVIPHRPWHPDPNSPDVRAALPPLLRGYLPLGAWVCGPPAYDPVFDCADFFMLLDLARLSPRHRQHFIGDPR